MLLPLSSSSVRLKPVETTHSAARRGAGRRGEARRGRTVVSVGRDRQRRGPYNRRLHAARDWRSRRRYGIADAMMSANERVLPDGRVELVDTRRIESSALFNHDLAPVPLARRN